MTTPTMRKPLNLSLRMRDQVNRWALNDSLILEVLDQPFPDLRKLGYTVIGMYEGYALPAWLTAHLEIDPHRNHLGNVVVALSRVQYVLRRSPRHPRPSQQFLRVPEEIRYKPRHLSPPSS